MGNIIPRTIREREGYVLYKRNGEGKIITGPATVRVGCFEQLEGIKHYIANEQQYLAIQYHDGHTEHRPGPCDTWFNPIEHKLILIKEATELTANEVLIVYRKRDGKENVDRVIVNGPILHVPRSDEWIHEFVWHGSANGDKTRKVPGATRFTKLRVIPDQFYYNVREVRTRDEAVITVKLMIFYELRDIIRMLETTHDPIADFINGASADVISFASTMTYEEFVENSKQLNELDFYPQLVKRCKGIGFEITKVVFRGYVAGDALQQMNNDAIASRTQLRLTMETEEQKQRLADFQLQKQLERAEKQQLKEQEEKEHQLELERKGFEEVMRQQRLKQELELESSRTVHDEQLRLEDAKSKQSLDHRRATHEEEERHLHQLQSMGVDLTKYLIAQYQAPEKFIRIDGANQGSSSMASAIAAGMIASH